VGLVVLLSLCSAVAYGVSDFVGGVLTRRASVWAAAATSQATATVLTIGLAGLHATDAHAGALLWGALGGIGSGAGNVFIYRGLGTGRMAVVAPLSAVAAAALPVLVGLVAGERPGMLRVIGVLMAIPAIWLVSGGASGPRDANQADLVNGLVAGVGFGLQFTALGQIPREAGLTALALSQPAKGLPLISRWERPWLVSSSVCFGALRAP
jgi:uncharacterized membrane protein